MRKVCGQKIFKFIQKWSLKVGITMLTRKQCRTEDKTGVSEHLAASPSWAIWVSLSSSVKEGKWHPPYTIIRSVHRNVRFLRAGAFTVLFDTVYLALNLAHSRCLWIFVKWMSIGEWFYIWEFYTNLKYGFLFLTIIHMKWKLFLWL